MQQVVIIPGGFHPFHAGHMALYTAAQQAFPAADVYVAATDDQSTRPFPFAVKEKLARLAGVEPGHFVKVKSPFSADEITGRYDPNEDVVVFVRSEKDRDQPPRPGLTKKDGSPAKLQPLTDNPEPFGQHTYIAYLPTVEFGPGLTSATQIRTAWPTLNDKRKTALVMSLYPRTQGNTALADNVVHMLDQVLSPQTTEDLDYIDERTHRPG
jgi:glycerol-3-phosphate cytidylyltransferase-like family protein